ncbi:MAG TPA: hypothetical protein VKV39_08185 [Candidatus Sulfotelmatobacter sp.]|nr:hypothetical protein [Candidatus Sulfotelmatobacter sp.]
MKVRHIVYALALLAFSNMASAECPKDASLARVEGILDFCAHIDPALAPEAGAFKRLVVQGVSQKDLNDILESPGFRESYDAIQDQLKTVPRTQAISACTMTLAPAKK